jgi:dihydrofolate reductase
MTLGLCGSLKAMIRYSTSISLDGYTAGPEQSRENPLGLGGMELHGWLRSLASWRQRAGLEGGVDTVSADVLKAVGANLGAYVMGRNMFGGGPGPWGDDPWNGWWGDNPPFHLPVFVVTHHARPPLECEGGTTFTFVTEGPEAAVAQARAAAAGGDVLISGGATVGRQCLEAGLVDELGLDLVPVLLGAGVRLFDGMSRPIRLEQVKVVEAPGVTHLTYRVS